MSGLFITMEGTDGSGKTTQIKLLSDYLEKAGYDVVCTREPGGTKIGEKIRSILIDTENKNMSNITEMFLYSAARAQLVKEVIIPKMNGGGIVISDRFVDSSIVYQGMAREIGEKEVKEVNKYAVGNLLPDITFLLELDFEKGIKRKKQQSKLDRIEGENLYFHKKVFYGYKKLASKNSNRIKVIDASLSENEIHKIIVESVNSLINGRSF